MYLRQEISPKEKSLTHLNDEKVVSKHGSTEINSIIAEKESIFSQILSSEIDVSDRKILIKRVFEHSLEDGLKLAEKSQYTSKDYLETISSSKFFLKHNDFLNHLISEGEKKVKSESDKIALQTLKESLSEHENILKSNFNTLLLRGNEKLSSITSINLKTYLDDWYSQFISLKSVDTVSEYDPRSKGERMSEECLQYVLPSLKKMYHANGILTLVIKKIDENNHEKLKPILQTIFDQDDYYRYRCSQSFEKFFDSVIKGKLNLNKYFDQFIENIFSKEEVAHIIGSNKITAKQAEIIANTFELEDLQVKNERIVATNEVLKVSAKLAGENLLKDLNLAGVQIIWNEAKQEYEPFIKNKESESKLLTEAKILDQYEKMINDGVDVGWIAAGLAGLDSERAWKMRYVFYNDGVDKSNIAMGLAGLDSERAWKMRHDLNNDGVYKGYIAKGLAGVDSERAWKMRDNFIKDGVKKDWIAAGLAGVDSERAWKMRYDFHNDGVDKSNIAMGLAGVDSERAWKMRDDFVKAGVDKGWIAMGLAGVDSERAWKMRDDFVKAGVDNRKIAKGLAGVDSERAWKMRDDFVKAGVDKSWIAEGLAGLDSERAWKMREDFIMAGVGKNWIAIGLAGDYTSFVWQFKQERQGVSEEVQNIIKLLNLINTLVPVKVEQPIIENKESESKYLTEAKILDELEKMINDGVNKNWIAQGLAGLDSERAWKMRDDLIKSGALKVTIAQGLAGLDSERAWEMRNDFIKAGVGKNWIAQGLAGIDSERAWEMRNDFVKAGIDKSTIAQSLAGIDSERAWKMRNDFIKDGVFKGWIASSFAGLDSERAWEMRNDFIKAGADFENIFDKNSIAQSLAGIDSERAWEMRNDFVKAGVDKNWIAQGLVGLDSERAWKMREDFVKAGVDKGHIALSLAGDYTSFVWQFKHKQQGISGEVENNVKHLNSINTLESVKVEQPIIENNESESKFLTEAKILDELEKMINDGVDKGWIADDLAGLDSERAWKMRDDFVKTGVDKNWIALGLAGVDSEKAWKMRDDFIKAGVDKNNIALGLAGLDSERAWKMRDDFIKAGVDKDFIALGLAGLDSERAWKMRDDFIKAGVNKAWIASALAGLDSDRAWKMRDDIINSDANKTWIVRGLAGLDSDRAWKMRNDFIKDGVEKRFITRGLAGLDSERAWKMRNDFIMAGVHKGAIAEGLAGLDSERAWKMRNDFIMAGVDKGAIAEGLAGDYTSFVWQLKQKQQSIPEEVQNVMEHSINDIDNLELAERIEDYLTNYSKISELRSLSVKQELRRFVSSSKQAVKNINSLIKATPELFIETIKAKNESTRIKNQLMYKVFPSTRPKAKQSWRNFYEYFNFSLNTNPQLDARPEDYLNPDRMESLVGGDPEAKEGLEKEVMIFREPVSGLVVTKTCSKLVGNNWDSSYQFPLAKLSMERAKENTVTLPRIGPSVVLPKLLNSVVIPERIKGVKDGKEIPLEGEFTTFNEVIVRDVKKANSIVYSLQIDELPKAMNKISLAEYNKFKERFVSTHDAEMTKKIASLPEEIKLFLNSINDQEPAVQVQLIEQFVREISYYDMKNAEVIPLKINKSLDERLEIMETRIDELISVSEANKDVLLGKKYAGVCADFASLTVAMLREAGFLSGVLTGFSAQGRTVTINQAHATAFVVWPDAENGNQIFSVDGTPDGISGVSLPSLQQQEKIREDKIEEITTKSDEELEEITKILTSMDERMIRDLTNGQLESVLNNVLRYGVNIEVLQAVTSLFELYSFSPLYKFDLENLDDKIKIIKFIKTELERARQEKIKSQVKDPGSMLFKAVEKFIKRFADDNNSKQGIEIIDQLLNLVGDILNPIERKALTTVVTYLKAKEMLGGNKQ